MQASEVLDQSAVLLNDTSKVMWTNAVLLPVLTKANEELEQLLEVNEVPLQRQVAAVIDVAALATEVAQPTDFIAPLELRERADGTTSGWGEKIDPVDFIDPNNTTSSEINEWCWRDAKIKINPPTTAREVLLTYERKLTPLTAVGSTVELTQAKTWLAARTAQLAAQNLGHNPTKAQELQVDVDRAEDLLIRMLVKRNQKVGVRRRPYKGRHSR